MSIEAPQMGTLVHTPISNIVIGQFELLNTIHTAVLLLLLAGCARAPSRAISHDQLKVALGSAGAPGAQQRSTY
jgi:hypothetical protein